MAKVSKDTQRGYFYEGAFPTDTQMDNVVDSQLGVLDDVSSLPAASASNLGDEYKVGNVFYKCELVSGQYQWVSKGTVTPPESYNDLEDKPKIGSATLAGDMTVDDIGGLSKDETDYDSVAVAGQNDTVYICQGGVWKKTTVGAVRRPATAQVAISPSSWTQSGELYEAVASVSGISSTSIVMATPAPESIPIYNDTPFWISSVGNAQVTVQSSEQISEQVKINIIYW